MHFRLRLPLRLLLLASCLASSARAQITGTWTNTTSSAASWSTTSNWSGGSVAGGLGATANLTANLTTAQTITLPTSVTLGTLNIGDPTAPLNGYTLTGSQLVFDVASGSAGFNQAANAGSVTIASNLRLNDATTFNLASGATTTVTGSISGLGLTKSGTGILELAARNTLTSVTVSSGTLRIADTNALATSNLSVSSGTVSFGTLTTVALASFATTTPSVTTSLTNTNGQPIALVVGGRVSLNSFVVGPMTGTGSFTKIGPSTAVLYQTAKTYTGNTTVASGTLAIDFTAGPVSATNIVSPSSALVMNGGTLSVVGNTGASTTTSQTFAGTTFAPGASSVTRSPGTGLATNVELGAISRQVGGTANFAASGGGNITTTSAGSAFAGWGTVAGTDWATVNGSSQIVAVTSYTDNTWAVDTYTNITGNLGFSNATTGSLRFAANAERSISLTGTNTLTTGGILVSSAVGSNQTEITGGTLRGSAAGDLILINHSTGTLRLSTAIADNSGATALTKSGAGPVVLSGANTFTGGIYINEGTLSVSALNAGDAIRIAGGATLAYTGSGQTVTRALDLNGATIPQGNFSTAATLDGSGSGGLVFSGSVLNTTAGQKYLQLTGTGSNTFTSALERSADPTVGGIALSKSGTGTWTLSGNNSNDGLITVNAGTLILTGNNATATGDVAVGAGTLAIGHDNALGTGLLSILAATPTAVLQAHGGARTVANDIDAAWRFSVTGSHALTFSGTLTNTAATNFTPTISNTGVTTFNHINLSNSATDRSMTMTVSSGSSAAIIGTIANGGISTGGSFAKAGGGTLTLSGANTYGGSTTLSAGTLSINTITSVGGGPSALGAPSSAALGIITINGFSNGVTTTLSSLQYTGTGHTTDRTINLTGSTDTSRAYSSLDASGSGTLAFSTTGTAVTGTGQSLGLTGTGNGTIAGALAFGAGGLVKTGSGTWTLSGSSTYTGRTSINGGTLAVTTIANVGAASPLGAPTDTAQLTDIHLDTGTLRYTGTGDATNRVMRINTGGGTLEAAGSGTFTINPGSSGTSVFGVGYNLTLAGAGTGQINGDIIIGGGTLTKSGTGTWILAGSMVSQAGPTIVSAGTLQLGGGDTDGALPSSMTVAAGATLAIGRSDNIALSSMVGGTLSGAGNLRQVGPGTLTLSTAVPLTGSITAASGTLALGASNVIGNTSPLVIDGGTFSLGAFSDTVANVTLRSGSITGSTGAKLTGSAYAFETGSVSAVLDGTAALTKTTGGTVTLSGANLYSGGTIISGGTVRIDNTTGSAFGTGAVDVQSGAMLTGTGSFTGPLTVSGQIAPGNSSGAMHVGPTQFSSGGNYAWETNSTTGIAGTQWDLISISGTLYVEATSAAPFTISLLSLTAGNASGDVFNFTSGGTYSFTILTTTAGILNYTPDSLFLNTAGFTNLDTGTWSLALTNGNRDLTLTYTGIGAVPEPATYATLAGLAGLALAFLRRRRNT